MHVLVYKKKRLCIHSCLKLKCVCTRVPRCLRRSVPESTWMCMRFFFLVGEGSVYAHIYAWLFVRVYASYFFSNWACKRVRERVCVSVCACVLCVWICVRMYACVCARVHGLFTAERGWIYASVSVSVSHSAHARMLVCVYVCGNRWLIDREACIVACMNTYIRNCLFARAAID